MRTAISFARNGTDNTNDLRPDRPTVVTASDRDAPTDRIFGSPISCARQLVDDGHARRVVPVAGAERPPAHDRDAHGGEVFR
jgi:hypothetical protein